MKQWNTDLQTKSSLIAELKNIPTEEEMVTMLKSGIVIVTFKKLDGDERRMTCTKDLNLVPEENRPKTNKEGKVGNINVWDINAQGWRSFKYDRVVKVEV